MASGLGFLLVAALTLVGAALLFGLHRLARPTGALESRASEALRELEPRGGRQRFSVRLFEVAVLTAAWVAATGALALWVPVASSLPLAGTLVAMSVVISLAVATWWAWRRGALRPPRGPSVLEREGLGEEL